MPTTYPAPLQGGAIPLQGTIPNLQGGANPQNPAPAATIAPATPVQVPQAFHIQPQIGTGISTPAPQPAPVTPSQPAQAQPLNSIFQPHLATRPSQVNPNVPEYYRTDTGQGFSSPPDLFNYASTLGAGQVNSFGQLHAPVNTASAQNYQSQIPTNQNQQLAQTAGNAGLSVDDLTKLAQANSTLTPEEIQQIRDEFGLDTAAAAATAPPAQNTVDLYNKAYQQAGLGDLKSQILNLSQQIAKA